MFLNRLKKIPHLTPVRKHVMSKNRTPTQVNAKALLREVHTTEEEAQGSTAQVGKLFLR